MFTETTDNIGVTGWVLYDGECSMCIDLAGRFRKILARRRFGLSPLQTPWVQHRLNAQPGEPPPEMAVFTRDGRTLGGADAILYIARFVWWGWPMVGLSYLPGIKPLLRRVYAWIAVRRHCFGGACRIDPHGRSLP